MQLRQKESPTSKEVYLENNLGQTRLVLSAFFFVLWKYLFEFFHIVDIMNTISYFPQLDVEGVEKWRQRSLLVGL